MRACAAAGPPLPVPLLHKQAAKRAGTLITVFYDLEPPPELDDLDLGSRWAGGRMGEGGSAGWRRQQ
jgi:hypothetical protein